MEIYKYLVKLSDKNQKYKEQIVMFEQMGYCCHVVRKYKQAIIWFKKQLELAWFEKDKNGETEAYGNIGREHFYLGDLDKALYYNDRMVRGKVENERSSLKTMSHHVVKNRREAKLDK
jgi:tetratricopeptide (TPR) repeat protein